MNILRKPIGATAMVALILILSNFTNFKAIANSIGLTLILLFLTLLIHELGHVVFGKWSGYRFNYLTVGPLTFENTDRLRMKWNESWYFVGGISSCAPLSSNLSSLTKQHKHYIAGGPVFSIAAAMFGLVLGTIMELELVTYFGLFNLIIFIVTILPYKGAIKSDGRVLIELSKGNQQAEEYLLSLLLINEMNTPKHPANWSSDLIEQAKTLQPTVDNAAAGYIIFYYTLLKENYRKASAFIESYKQLPITKQNKFALQFINHIKQIDFIVSGEYEEEKIRQLHQYLLPIDPISYKRSEAILAKLKGNHEQASVKFSEALYEIEKGKKVFGFYHAEEVLTNILEQALFIGEN